MSTRDPRLPIAQDPRLNGILVELVVELCRIRMTALDVASLAPKDIIPLSGAAERPLALVAHGTELARGELMIRDGRLCTRILQLPGWPFGGGAHGASPEREEPC